MFSFFKRKTKFNKEIFESICSLLPDKYMFLSNQVKENIILSVKKENDGYYKFNLDNSLFDKYEDKHGRYYEIKGIFLLYKNIRMPIALRVGYGILLGYSVKDNNLLSSLSCDVSIDVSNIEIKFFDNVDKRIIDLFSDEELKYITPNEIYEIWLNGKMFYHLQDIEDGDFIAIDESEKVYMIRHNPLNREMLSDNLLDVLKKNA